MTDAVSIAIVTQLGALALAGLAALISWRTHKAVNSRMDEFKVMFAAAKINEGVLQEKKDEVVRKAEIVIAIGHGDTAISKPFQPVATVGLAKAIEKVPEKTATIVVEKLDEQKQAEK